MLADTIKEIVIHVQIISDINLDINGLTLSRVMLSLGSFNRFNKKLDILFTVLNHNVINAKSIPKIVHVVDIKSFKLSTSKYKFGVIAIKHKVK